jgi:hypothetical protein
MADSRGLAAHLTARCRPVPDTIRPDGCRDKKQSSKSRRFPGAVLVKFSGME